MLTKSCEKVAPFFCCKICDYNTSRKSSFDKHITTAKHSKLTSVNIKSCKENGKSYCCKNCNKDFKSRVGLWKHNKICLFTEQTQKEKSQMENDPTDKQLIMKLLKDNSDLKNIMMEVMKNGIVNNKIKTTSGIVEIKINSFNYNNDLYIIIEGFLLFCWEEVVDLCEEKFYIKSSYELCRDRRYFRDYSYVNNEDHKKEYDNWYENVVYKYFLNYVEKQMCNLNNSFITINN